MTKDHQAPEGSGDYTVSYTDPIFTPKMKLSVICIGAGASGLLLAYKLDRHFGNFDLRIYEKNIDTGGTWFENRYPGCACDVPSHCYTWSFEPKTDWSGTYASSSEIRDYFKDFAANHNLNRFIKLSHEVVSATWNGGLGIWNVEIKNNLTGTVIRDSAQVLINCGGVLNAWKWPNIPGIDKFRGPLVHSANWDESVSLEGKVVGLIGNGSSGIQILPAIQPVVSKLVTFIRSPTWVSPLLGLDESRSYTKEEKKKYATDVDAHLKMRQDIEGRMNSAYEMFFHGSDKQKMMRAYMEKTMKERLGNAGLEEKIIPKWSIGCRRLTPGVDYLEGLSKPNVETVFGEVTQITEDGVVVNGMTECPLEVIICATGFDTTFKPRFPISGIAGEQLANRWKEQPQGYFGLAVSGFPNYFMTLGPNCPVGNGPVLIAIEVQIDYIIQMLAKMQKENVKTLNISAAAEAEFNQHKDLYMENMIWNENCRSWYKTGPGKGKVTALWPGSTLHYLEAMKQPRYEDWNFTYPTNRYAYLASGLSTAEKVTGDLSWYIKPKDDSPIDPCLKRGRL